MAASICPTSKRWESPPISNELPMESALRDLRMQTIGDVVRMISSSSSGSEETRKRPLPEEENVPLDRWSECQRIQSDGDGVSSSSLSSSSRNSQPQQEAPALLFPPSPIHYSMETKRPSPQPPTAMPLLSTIHPSLWPNKRVLIQVGPLRSKTGIVVGQHNGWVTVALMPNSQEAGIVTHTRRAFELSLVSRVGLQEKEDGMLPTEPLQSHGMVLENGEDNGRVEGESNDDD